ncbi:SnoaL-like protein [Salana multivorans]|uniref:SnoaL-like protein n=1 Tax=Salana multivorans TaxID=120377 RepID=A0A3N2D0N5_9MICO|nr:nuclear transport factor 2 family protein [Salana multivorans]ROR93311.1 SnoaL-like protein [Salana multivorans]
MKAVEALSGLMTAIDERRWADMAAYLHPEFRCRYSHTGEVFTAEEWIRLNAEYPGFDHLTVRQLVGDDTAAACRAHVTGEGETGLSHFECATFITMADGLIREMTEVWADVAQQAPPGTRPAS